MHKQRDERREHGGIDRDALRESLGSSRGLPDRLVFAGSGLFSRDCSDQGCLSRARLRGACTDSGLLARQFDSSRARCVTADDAPRSDNRVPQPDRHERHQQDQAGMGDSAHVLLSISGIGLRGSRGTGIG